MFITMLEAECGRTRMCHIIFRNDHEPYWKNNIMQHVQWLNTKNDFMLFSLYLAKADN